MHVYNHRVVGAVMGEVGGEARRGAGAVRGRGGRGVGGGDLTSAWARPWEMRGPFGARSIAVKG